jgi:hypothetical protein
LIVAGDDSWRKFDTQAYKSDQQVTEYLAALRKAVHDFDVKRRLLAEQHKKDMETTIGKLRHW